MKKFFRMVMALSLVGGAFAFTGCTDYEDDIKALDDRVSALESTVADLQSKIDAGAVITDVTETEDGVTVTLSNGDSFTLTNGAAGTPGSVVTIGENGNWYIDNVDTGKPSRGEEGAAGADADIVYYRPNMETGNWDKVTISAETGEETVEPTEESWKAAGVTAVWDEENGTLTFTNVEGSDEPIVISLSTGMVTSVELVLSYTSTQQDDAPELMFSTVTEQENVFEEEGWDGQAISNQITFTKGAQTQTASSFIVRVSPANAVLTPDMISLVNSKGENLDDFVTVTKVEKYNELLTRAATNNGLWEVSVELQSYDEDTFAAKQYADPEDVSKGKILYAVQVNNTKEGDADRYVTSTYDVTLNYDGFKPTSDLNFFVGDRYVSTINNRYSFANNPSLVNYNGNDTPATEYTWDGGSDTPSTTPVFTSTNPNAVNTMADSGDDRHDEKVYPAVQGEEITIALTTDDSKVVSPDDIRAMYVTLDKEDNAVESAPSEWNAWESYVYTGLNTVVEGTEVTITINPAAGQNILNDYIGFRVFAVYYDGTLVDPDGKAFYVKVGDEAAAWNAVATTIVPDASTATVPSSEKSDPYTVSGLSKLSGTGLTATWTTTDQGRNGVPAFDVEFYAGGTTPVFTASYNAHGTTVPSTVEFDKVTSIRTKPASDIDEWYKLNDGQAYTGTLTISNSEDFVLATMNITMTKKLPAVPAGFSIKTNQLDANGVYNCYLVPNDWTAPNATSGKMDMDDVFNWGTGVVDQFIISFADAARDINDNTKIVANKVQGDKDNNTLIVDKEFIDTHDKKTQHETTVSYNFGKISSAEKDARGNVIDYVRPVIESFPTVFTCIYNDTYTWHWATIEEIADYYGSPWDGKGVEAPSTELVYGTDYTFSDPKDNPFSFAAVIKGVSSRDGKYSAWLEVPYENSLQLQEVGGAGSGIWGQVITKDGNKVNEYFQVSKDAQGRLFFDATAISDDTNPTGPVPSTLRLQYKDMYGHPVTVNLDVTVVKR